MLMEGGFVLNVNKHIARYLPVYITIAAILAYLYPDGFSIFMGSTNFLLGFVLFLAGLSMSLQDLKVLKKSFFIMSIGLILKWTLTVTISIILATFFFSKSPDIADGLILTGSVPSGTAATLYTLLAGGNASLIVAMGILDVFVSPFLTPAIMDMFSNSSVSVSFFQLAKKMFFIIILPIIAGMSIHQMYKTSLLKIKGYTKFMSSLTIIIIVLTVVSSVSSKVSIHFSLLISIFMVVFIQVLLPMLAGYKIAILLGIRKTNAIAILFEVGLCNSALAAVLALEFFGELAAIPAVINMVINLSLGAFFSNYFAKKV